MERSRQCRQLACPSDNRLGSCNAACGRYRRGHQNGWLGRGAGHPSAELSLGSRGVMNRRTLGAMILGRRLLDELRLGSVSLSCFPLGVGSIFHLAQLAGLWETPL